MFCSFHMSSSSTPAQTGSLIKPLLVFVIVSFLLFPSSLFCLFFIWVGFFSVVPDSSWLASLDSRLFQQSVNDACVIRDEVHPYTLPSLGTSGPVGHLVLARPFVWWILKVSPWLTSRDLSKALPHPDLPTGLGWNGGSLIYLIPAASERCQRESGQPWSCGCYACAQPSPAAVSGDESGSDINTLPTIIRQPVNVLIIFVSLSSDGNTTAVTTVGLRVHTWWAVILTHSASGHAINTPPRKLYSHGNQGHNRPSFSAWPQQGLWMVHMLFINQDSVFSSVFCDLSPLVLSLLNTLQQVNKWWSHVS